jgi:hypothetical protein
MLAVILAFVAIESHGSVKVTASREYVDQKVSTNNHAFVTAITNSPVAIAPDDGITLGEFGEYGTLGALLAAIAAAITWLKGNKANSADLSYSLVSATINNGTARLVDRAVNKVTVDDSVSSSSLTFIFPEKTEGKARDFFIRLIITRETIPTLSFLEPNGDNVSFDMDDDSWADIDQGVNLLMFTDTEE